MADPLFNKSTLNLLDSTRFERRDNEKLDMIFRAMKQYEVDIKSLKAHVVINVGLVSGRDNR